MAAPASSYVYMLPLQQALFDKDTGLLMAGGEVSFWSDAGHTVPKNVYAADNSIPQNFVSVGAVLDLSIIGTFVNPNDGTNFVPFLWPYVGDPSSVPPSPLPASEPYYIRVKNADGVFQFDANQWPPGSSSGSSATARAPTVQIFTSGSATYARPSPSPLYLRVQMVGGGGGGGGSGRAGGTAATSGGNTTFGTSLLTCNGGVAGVFAGSGGTGGSATIGAGADGLATSGGSGGQAAEAVLSPGEEIVLKGGMGGSSLMSGSSGQGYTVAGYAGGYGAGGGGAGTGVVVNDRTWSGSGGGAGAYIDAVISSPSATYSYVVGAGGTAGGAGTGGNAGGAGGSGLIIVWEYYQ